MKRQILFSYLLFAVVAYTNASDILIGTWNVSGKSIEIDFGFAEDYDELFSEIDLYPIADEDSDIVVEFKGDNTGRIDDEAFVWQIVDDNEISVVTTEQVISRWSFVPIDSETLMIFVVSTELWEPDGVYGGVLLLSRVNGSGGRIGAKLGPPARIYVLEGHSEYTLTQLGLLQLVEEQNFTVESLNLLTTPQVPDDADIILVLSPEVDLIEREVEALNTYFENNGSAMFFFDFNGADLPRFQSLLGSFGVSIGNGIVMEGDRNYLYSPDNPLWLAPSLIPHDITDRLISSGLTVLMPTNMPVTTLESRTQAVIIEPLMQTSEDGWIRLDLDDSSMLKQPGDIDGPIDLAVAISRQKVHMDEPEGYRIIVAGNASFIGSISYFGNLKPNTDFFLNCLALN